MPRPAPKIPPPFVILIAPAESGQAVRGVPKPYLRQATTTRAARLRRFATRAEARRFALEELKGIPRHRVTITTL